MKRFLVKLLLIGSTLSIGTAFALHTQDPYQHTYWYIVNNTSKQLYIWNHAQFSGKWRKPISSENAMPIPTGTYSNVLDSTKFPYSNQEKGEEASLVVCENPIIHDGKAYNCSAVTNFCSFSSKLDSQAPHYSANVDSQRGTLSCDVKKQITPDGIAVTFTVNLS